MANETPGSSADPNIAANLKMAEAFYEAAVKGEKQTQKEKDALLAVSEIYSKLAKQQADILATKEDIQKLDEKAKELMKAQETAQGARKKQIEKELLDLREITQEKTKHRKESEKELETTKKQISELAKLKDKSGLGKIFTEISAKALAAVISVESLRRGFTTLLQTSKDIADISILSGKYSGMQGEGFLHAGGMIADYAIQVSKAQVTLAAFGYSAEEARGAFKDFAQLSGDTKQIESMTAASGALSRMLGVDLSESTGFMIEQSLRFNKTAAQSSQTLMGVQQSVEGFNKGLDKSIIRGRDVTKVLFDISRESKALAQDQEAIAKILISNVVNLQKGGVSYKEAFDTAKKFTEILTTSAPEFMQILGGRRIYGELTKNKDAMLAELSKSAPEVAKRVEDIMKKIKTGDISQYAGERMLNELLGQTKMGLKASAEEFSKTLNINAQGGAERVAAVYHTSLMQAQQLIESANKTLEAGKISDLISKSAKETPIDLKAQIKTQFDLDINEKDVAALKAMTDEQRQGAMQSLIDEKAKNQIKDQEDKAALMKADQIRDKEAEYQRLRELAATTGSELAQKQANEVKNQLDALREGPKVMDDIAKTLKDKLLQIDFKGYADSVLAYLKNPIAQIALGLTSLLGLVTWEALKYKQSRDQTKLLAQIAENTRGTPGGGGPPGEEKSEIGKGLDMLKKGRGMLAKGAALIPGIGGALNTGVGTLATSGVGGAATVAGGAVAAGAVGYGIGKYIANPIIDALTNEKNQYGQTSNIVERGFGKIAELVGAMSSKDYQNTYGNGPAPVDVVGMGGPAAPPGVPGAVGQAGGPGGGIGFKSEVVPGAGGYDIQLTPFKLGLPAALGANMGLMNKMAARAAGQ